MARAMVKVDETRKLPVWATVAAAYGFFWDNRAQFLRLAPLPLLAVIIVSGITDYAFGIEKFEFEQDLSATQTAASVLVGYVNIIIYTPFFVAWSRLLLTREISQTESAGIRVGRRELRYMAWSAIVVTLIQLPFLSWLLAENWFGLSDLVESEALDDELGLLPALAIFAWTGTILFAIFYLGARLMLVLPAISVSQRLSLAMSWRLTRRSGLRIAAVLIAAILPELVVWIMVAELGPVLDRPAVYITALALFSIVDVASIAIVVTVSCLCFCVFTGWPRRDLLQG